MKRNEKKIEVNCSLKSLGPITLLLQSPTNHRLLISKSSSILVRTRLPRIFPFTRP